MRELVHGSGSSLRIAGKGPETSVVAAPGVAVVRALKRSSGTRQYECGTETRKPQRRVPPRQAARWMVYGLLISGPDGASAAERFGGSAKYQTLGLPCEWVLPPASMVASAPGYRAGAGGTGSSGMFQDGYGLVCAGPNVAPAPASARLIGPATSSMVVTPVVSSALPRVRTTMV